MNHYKKVVHFLINRNDGAALYDSQIARALNGQLNGILYTTQDIKDYNLFPRFLALILFWLRAQYTLFFGRIDIAIACPGIMLVFPKYVSIICIAHHYDPSVFKGLRRIYSKLSNWLFMSQKARVQLVVTCSKYWTKYFELKAFKNVRTIYNGFDIHSIDSLIVSQDHNLVLKKYNLISKKYLHLGKYGPAQGQRLAIKCLKSFNLPMISTGLSKNPISEDLHNFIFINASLNEYIILLKNAKAVISMTEFDTGWCRVLHEAAILGTPILGSGLGGMNELLKIGGFAPSTVDTLNDDLDIRCKDGSLANDKMNLYREFTLERFYEAWRRCVNELL